MEKPMHGQVQSNIGHFDGTRNAYDGPLAAAKVDVGALERIGCRLGPVIAGLSDGISRVSRVADRAFGSRPEVATAGRDPRSAGAPEGPGALQAIDAQLETV